LAATPEVLRHDKALGALESGTSWLIKQAAGDLDPAPIGFYFAKLWYYEKLYPLIFTTATLRRVRQRLDTDS
jgi:squalene-hopene/tetraprenyl-beta-curcumene cyclase